VENCIWNSRPCSGKCERATSPGLKSFGCEFTGRDTGGSPLQPERGGRSRSGCESEDRTPGRERGRHPGAAPRRGRVKRRVLIRHLRAHHRELLREGSKHSVYFNPTRLIRCQPNLRLTSLQCLESPEIDAVRDVGLAFPACPGGEEVGLGPAAACIRDECRHGVLR